MGKIPTERLQPAPAWSYTSVDFFGPYEIKGETNKRSRSKGYSSSFVTITLPDQRIIVLVPIEEAELEPVKEADGQSE